MSKTDKTDPYWVKGNDPTQRARTEYHDHSTGDCDIADAKGREVFWYSRSGNCGYNIPYYRWNDGFYSNAVGRWAKAEKKIREGSARTKLARDRHELVKLSRDEIENYDVINPRHRHGVLWEW